MLVDLRGSFSFALFAEEVRGTLGGFLYEKPDLGM
jgi:hypothetical protein